MRSPAFPPFAYCHSLTWVLSGPVSSVCPVSTVCLFVRLLAWSAPILLVLPSKKRDDRVAWRILPQSHAAVGRGAVVCDLSSWCVFRGSLEGLVFSVLSSEGEKVLLPSLLSSFEEDRENRGNKAMSRDEDVF